MNRKEYLFSLLTEEASEIAQAANKCNRFTPEHAYYEQSNIERLQVEITDFVTVLYLLEQELGITFELNLSTDKLDRIEKYMQTSRDMGTLQDGNPSQNELLFEASGA
jgi:NTP pyrophosphatase (non-canonical NTP hydrolase)